MRITDFIKSQYFVNITEKVKPNSIYFNFNNEDQLASVLFKIDNDYRFYITIFTYTDGKLTREELKTYGSKNVICKVQYKYLKSKTRITIDSLLLFKYLPEKITQLTGLEEHETIIREYDGNGRIIRTYEYDEEYADKELDFIDYDKEFAQDIYYKYDKFGRMIQKSIVKDEWVAIHNSYAYFTPILYHYDYDDLNRRIHMSVNGDIYDIAEDVTCHTYYKYDELGRLIHKYTTIADNDDDNQQLDFMRFQDNELLYETKFKYDEDNKRHIIYDYENPDYVSI